MIGPPKIHSLARLKDFATLKNAFTTSLPVTWAKVPNKKVQQFLYTLPVDGLLTLPKFKAVQPLDSQHRKVFLYHAPDSLLEGITLQMDTLTFTFENWTMDQVLGALALDAPSSFETAGHLVRLNLPEEMDDQDASIIGQVILEKLPHVKTVVRKTHNIENEFRVLPIKLIAGLEDYVVNVKESNCTFTFDYRNVYWNSRLQQEHQRLVQENFQTGQCIVDLFCGVGPFAIPAARNRQCRVIANDLNPASIHWLRHNISKNNVIIIEGDGEKKETKRRGFIQVFNMDARDLTRHLLKEAGLVVDHVVMNLPATSVTFLNLFPGGPCFESACFHCYIFAKSEQEDPAELIKQNLQPGYQIVNPKDGTFIIKPHLVRNVAPKKDMYCVSFKIVSSESSKEFEGVDEKKHVNSDIQREFKRTKLA